MLNSRDLNQPFGGDSRIKIISTHRKTFKKPQIYFCHYSYTSGGKVIANHHQKWLVQRGDQVTEIYVSPEILDIFYKTRIKTNQYSMPLYDSTNPIPSLYEMTGQNNIPREKYLQSGTTNKYQYQFIKVRHKSRFASRNRIDVVQKPDALIKIGEINFLCTLEKVMKRIH